MGNRSSTSLTACTASFRSRPVKTSAARVRSSEPRPDSISALRVGRAVRSGAIPAAGRSSRWSPRRVTTRGAPLAGRAMPNGRFSIGKSVSGGTGSQVRSGTSKIGAARLVALDRFEQCLEVAFAEAGRAVTLDDLEEHSRTVGDRLGGDLEQVAVVVAVGENVSALQRVPRQVECRERSLGGAW